MLKYCLGLAIFFIFLCGNFYVVQAQECEVCVEFLKKVSRIATEESGESKPSQEFLKKILLRICDEATRESQKFENDQLKNAKFCYFIGAVKQAATSIVNEVTLPLSFPKPAEKICQDLLKKDSQICDLKYDKPVDWDNLELSKMRVKQLKELLSKLGDTCKGCAEKSDYIERINELKPKSKKSEL